jgi:hypothetical protein
MRAGRSVVEYRWKNAGHESAFHAIGVGSAQEAFCEELMNDVVLARGRQVGAMGDASPRVREPIESYLT